jgi:hypothetical protein
VSGNASLACSSVSDFLNIYTPRRVLFGGVSGRRAAAKRVAAIQGVGKPQVDSQPEAID